MQIEIDLLLKKLVIQEEQTIAGMPFYIGEFMGTEVIITRSGVGKVNAAACVQTLIHKFNVDSIINTGVAGGLHPGVKVGDLVISTNVTHHDFTYIKENNCSIYIASNGLKEYLRAIVTYYALDKWVTETFSIEQIQSLNKGDLVKSIMNQYDIKEAAVVGDRLCDINAAKDNGLLAIGCNFDFAQEDELAQADVVIDDLMELKGILPAVQR
ncbi:5'-nucleosidase [Bacillus thuringiensis]|nr:5'-methylthioadenosine/S-adenosylhomocysteine nucleosidase [Bacillus cereus]AGE78689.1 MTA/SAH nucleosidase / phosphatase [Bacillus thuringiensis serovar kurstaki str. HD73]AHZ51724.1 HAD superfamily hydrolase [Bacillus thuringiensis serovar kurstaki str. YBT-1520]AIE34145.1 HAD superfamily hydrolase [Bacillus thuringiensis serovar kurstaki str. HD-1]ALL59208.1 5'-nucleosidase [Bacillus thuringiensis]EEM52994.1 MTA/SAH nucleosidase / phosphatase [Bacillus thuringiensis serovar kurstaki str.